MAGDDLFTLRATSATYRLRVRHFDAQPADAGQIELQRQARLDLSVGIEWRDPEVLRVALALGRALSGRTFRDFDRVSAQPLSEQQVEALRRSLVEAFDLGRISVERESLPSLTERRELFNPELPPLPPPPRESPLTFFDVRFVDEIGQAVSGVSVEYQVDGGFRDVTTNAAGVALLEGVKDSTAKVSITEVESLEKTLDSRWTKRRLGSPPKEANLTKLVFQGSQVGPLGVKAVIPQTVVLEPPRGRLSVELLDKTGRVRHAKRAYTISGPESFSGTTDDAGMLRHDDVFPGDYTLALTLEFFERKDQQTDSYESPLEVLGPGDATPETRLLGAVPICVLARLHFFFNTNKTFLLPTALPSVRALRKLYLQNSPCKLLVVGHADTAGGTAYNDQLSLERAEATIAYLKDDVEGWFKFYGDSVEKKKRWGKAEDQLMIRSMPDFKTKPEEDDSVEWYQRTRELEVDGDAGKNTRRKLISEYMSLDGASLSELGIEIEATPHGCGEHFPLDDIGETVDEAPEDEKRDPIDRRVELFFFDPEFGIVPAPPGKNSKAGSAEYPAWRKGAIQTVDLEADDHDGPKVTFVELADAHFRTDSAVVLPEGENPDQGGSHEALTPVGLIAAALRFNEDHPGRTLLVAGHTDTEADAEYNQKLSEERAKVALALLKGDRDSFRSLCNARHTVADYKQILSWVSRAFEDVSFDCDPGKIDGNETTGVEPVRRFQKAYNANKAQMGITQPDIAFDGSVGKETWGAFFDCYEFALLQELEEESDGLAELRSKLKFTDPELESLGFSEHFPIEELGVDNFRSQTNRRVEILFFKPGEEPDLEHAEEDPETSELYLPGIYVREPVDRTKVVPTGRNAVAIRVPMRFSKRKTFPKPSAIQTLQVVLERMAQEPTATLVIVGHTDGIGSDPDNQALSLARAEAVRAWLTGDSAFFLQQFRSGTDPKKDWEWEELQWMLHGVQAAGRPCYVGAADGFPGQRTVEALGAFQLDTVDLAVSYAPDDATLERLCRAYVELLGGSPLDASRIEVVGGGSWHLPEALADSPLPERDSASNDLRRVELFVFSKAPRPPVSQFPTARATPAVYQSWCRQVLSELAAEGAPFVIEAHDPDGLPLANAALQIAEIVDDARIAGVGSVTTDERGAATLTVRSGLYLAQVQTGENSLATSFFLDASATCGAALGFTVGGGLDHEQVDQEAAQDSVE